MISLWVICLSIISHCSIEAKSIKPDIHPGIVRPCAYKDLDCIRKFFADHSACSPVYGSVPDPLIVTDAVQPIPHANVTVIYNNAQVNGLNNVVVTEFYINKATGRFVLEVEYREIAVSSKTGGVTIRYHLKGKEPVERTDAFYVAIRKVSITMVVPYVGGIQLSKGQVYTYLSDSNVSYYLGPNYISSDPGLQKSLILLLSKLSTSLREGLVILAPLYLSAFLETHLCKFTK